MYSSFFAFLLSFLTYSPLRFSVGIIDDFKLWLLEKLQGLINIVRDFFFEIFKAVTDFIKAMLLTVLDMLKDFFYFIFESFLSLLIVILNSLGTLFDAFDISNYWQDLPSEVTNIMGLLGLGHCMGLIVTALIIRMTLQLVPFTRLGS